MMSDYKYENMALILLNKNSENLPINENCVCVFIIFPRGVVYGYKIA